MTCAASVWPVHGSGSAHAARVLAGTIKGVENVVYRQSMLLSPEDFSVIFDKLESSLGHCAGWYAVDARDAARSDDDMADT